MSQALSDCSGAETDAAPSEFPRATRRYFQALDACRQANSAFRQVDDGARWLNLKGAARQAVWRKRRAELQIAEAALQATEMVLRDLVRDSAIDR